jgi:hypothetical protein
MPPWPENRSARTGTFDAERPIAGVMSLNSTPCGDCPAWFKRLIDSTISASDVTLRERG